jgi:hypothetical protein
MDQFQVWDHINCNFDRRYWITFGSVNVSSELSNITYLAGLTEAQIMALVKKFGGRRTITGFSVVVVEFDDELPASQCVDELNALLLINQLAGSGSHGFNQSNRDA